jgi:chemoreceptor-like protein with four helix bundle sensory module
VRDTVESAKALRRLQRLKPVIIGVVVLLIIAGTGFFIVWRLKTVAAGIVDDTLPELVYAGQINSELSENFAITLQVMNSNSPEEQYEYLKKISEGKARVGQGMDRYRRASRFEGEDRELFARLVTTREKYKAIRQRVFDLVKEGKQKDAWQLFESELRPAYTAQKAAGQALFDYNVNEGQSRGRRIENGCQQTEWVMAILCVGMFLGGFFTPFLAIRLPPRIWK